MRQSDNSESMMAVLTIAVQSDLEDDVVIPE